MKTKMDKSAEIAKKLEQAKKQFEEELDGSAEIVDVEGGLTTLLNKEVLILGVCYFYVGKLTGVNGTFIELTDAKVLYNADDFNPAKWKTDQFDKLPAKKWNIRLAAIESYGEVIR